MSTAIRSTGSRVPSRITNALFRAVSIASSRDGARAYRTSIAKIGLLPEPEHDRSGYRNYEAAAVVRLIRIRTLADAGVPLARVQELLDAGPKDFAGGVQGIDKAPRADIRRLQDTRSRLARLAAGEHLALPQRFVDYLDRLRGLGAEERYIEMERDAWIMIAAQVPHQIDSVIAKKHEELDEPDM